MALEAMGISKSEKIVEFFPWPFADVGAGESFEISARWIRFNAPWLTLKQSDSGLERNFSVQGLFHHQGRNYVLVRQARMNARGRDHGFVLARLDAGSVTVLTASELTELSSHFANAFESLFSKAEQDRQKGCVTGLERIVGQLTDWNLHEGPSFASFQISTTYDVDGRSLKEVDFVALAQWNLEENDVFVHLRAVSDSPGEEFQMLWLDNAPSASFVGLCKPIGDEEPDDERLVNIFIFHENGTFEVADSSEILQGVTRAFDAAECGNPLSNLQTISVLSSIAGEG